MLRRRWSRRSEDSTSGNIAVALSALRPGEPVLVQRHAHKSVLAGLVQVGALPVWLEPRWDAQFGVAHGLGADVVERALSTSGATALWVLHPTQYGTTADLTALSELCRRFGARLLVGGAHSPHFAIMASIDLARRQMMMSGHRQGGSVRVSPRSAPGP